MSMRGIRFDHQTIQVLSHVGVLTEVHPTLDPLKRRRLPILVRDRDPANVGRAPPTPADLRWSLRALKALRA